MEKNEIMTPKQFYQSKGYIIERVPEIEFQMEFSPTWKQIQEYAEYYHQAKQSIPVDMEKVIEAEYPIHQQDHNLTGEWTLKGIAGLNRKAAHFGYQLNRQVIDWEKIEVEWEEFTEIPICGMGELFNWFRSRISASSDAELNKLQNAIVSIYNDSNYTSLSPNSKNIIAGVISEMTKRIDM